MGSGPRFRSALVTFVLSCLVASGCNSNSSKPSQADIERAVQSFVQKLVLDIAGKSVEFPLEEMGVFLTEEDEYPETFEIRGPAVILGGTFPKDVRVDYGEHWNVLIGRPIPILARGGDPGQQADSQLTLPDGTKLKVLGGTFTTEKISEDFDAETPLSGKIELNCETPTGPKTYQGTFAVKGTTWG
jgi:hypothetical protein